MPVWLMFSLCSPLFFAIVCVADAYCVDELFDRAWMGGVTSAIASSLSLLFLPFFLPFFTWELPPLWVVALALCTGILIQASQFLYFQALSKAEAGIVAAYWNMVPAIVVLLSWLFLGQILRPLHFFGASLLIGTSVLFCLLDSERTYRWNTFGLMFMACCMQGVMFLLEEQVFEHASYAMGFLGITLGIILAGLLPLCLRRVRTLFRTNGAQLGPLWKFLLGIELINLLALACSQRAVDLGVPSLVASVETTIPAYTFGLSILALYVLPRFGDVAALRFLPQKLGLVTVMATGVWCLS